MSLFLHVLQPNELEEILALENRLLKDRIQDEMDRELFSWNARWRREALEHYLPLGWSFCVREDSELLGYFLGQAFLFLDGQTQSLWIEHLQFTNLQSRDTLVELAIKMGKEKHLQKVYFPNETNLQPALQPYKAEPWSPNSLLVRTTKT